MEKHIYELLYKTEERYWWFVGQRFLLYNILKKYCHNRKDLKLLDIGCGTGMNIKVLSNFGKAEGIDVSDDAIKFCNLRNINVKKSDVMGIKHKGNTFDVVTELGVFYHKAVTDDIKAMSEAHRILKPGGRFIMFDCAMKCLFGKHDIAFDGARRYSKRELAAKLKQAGFVVERITYFNTLLFPIVYLHRKLTNLTNSKPQSEVQDTINPLLNTLLKKLYKTELRGLKYINYPFGVNILAIARKPK